jgi:hypothetical protein
MKDKGIVFLKNIHTLWVDGKYACFRSGRVLSGDNEKQIEVRIPLNEITDNVHYFIDKRIEFITKKKQTLLAEQKELKQKLESIKNKL